MAELFNTHNKFEIKYEYDNAFILYKANLLYLLLSQFQYFKNISALKEM